ncbi:ATP-dependent zinc metalloprotease FtsH [Chitinispirillales bacterium ANBcel5]|uniref:ATP-dependent zinc metalloprotease FtsH n=1 Tax=Cellulosispirillum alkaliphilum TaxID=3039283 RepID=UPI002A525195|nr:ATP-dependent zinc metalloprotease FtsH [Chitinispirillales bacterium ANBcel5]
MADNELGRGAGNGKNGEPGTQGKFVMWRFLMWAAILTILFSYIFGSFTSEQRVSIPYSEFKNQVRTGNISEVMIRGEEIEGEFVEYYTEEIADGETVEYSHFATVKPPFDDSDLMGLLEEGNVTINAQTTERNWLFSTILLLLPWALVLLYFVYAGGRIQRQMKGFGGGGGLFSVGKSKAKRFEKEMTNTSYDHVAGLSNAKKDLQEIVDYLKDPGKFAKLGATIPKGVLLMGPPGTGKTLLAKATAGEAGVPFFSTSGSEFIEMFVGVGASRVRDMFETAKKEAPAIIFIDELDSVGRARGTGLGGSHDEREQTLNQILSEMDGFEAHQSVVVIAATNRPDVLDPALTRPGRFDRQIALELPQKTARLDILKIHASHVPVDPDLNLEKVAARTVGFSGADLQNLVNEAALLAGRKDKQTVDIKDFDEAQDKILLGAEREDKLNDSEKKIVAYHEAGHALVAKLLPEADPLQKVTIIARGRSLGATEQIPDTDRHNFNREYLLSRISVALGGRVSEKLIFDEFTSGAAQDLKHVTQIARKMVCQWGMSEKIGPATFTQGEEHPFLGRDMIQQKDFSEHTAKMIDEEIQRIIVDQEQKTYRILNENKEKLNRLAEALIEHETLENGEIEKLLNSVDTSENSPTKK